MTHQVQAQTVINAGHGGDNSRNLLKRLDADVLSHHPSLVVLLVGGNDVLNSGNSVSLEEYKRNLETLIRRIKDSSAKVLLLCPPPCYPPYLLKRHPAAFFQGKDPNERLAEVREIEKSVALAEQVPLLDLSKIFGDEWKRNEADSFLRNAANSKSEDGVHPTAAAYRVIAGAVDAVIQKNALPTDLIVCFGDSMTYGAAVKGAGTAEGETYPARLAELVKKTTVQDAAKSPAP